MRVVIKNLWNIKLNSITADSQLNVYVFVNTAFAVLTPIRVKCAGSTQISISLLGTFPIRILSPKPFY